MDNGFLLFHADFLPVEQLIEGGGQVEVLHKIKSLLQGLFALILRGIGLVGTNEDVLGRMGHIDKLQKSRLITDTFQQAATDGIGHQGSCALLDDAVFEKHVQIAALMNAAVDFMLAAGDGEDEICFLLNGIMQGKVRSHIAGMERYDEAVFLERMTGLLEGKTKTLTTTVQVEMLLVEDRWCMATNPDFSDAITGGMVSRYVELQKAIVEAMKKGDEE